VVCGEEFPVVLGPLLELNTLFTLVCVSRRVHEMYYKVIVRILKEENAASQLLRVCIRELHRRWRPQIQPLRAFFADMIYGTAGKSELFRNLNPTEFFNFYVTRTLNEETGKMVGFQMTISSDQYLRYTCIQLWNYTLLAGKMRMFHLDRPWDNMPSLKYEGEGEDPQIRTEAELQLSADEFPVLLTLNNGYWVGYTSSIGTNRYREFRFRKSPNEIKHALLLASDLMQFICCFAQHLELGIDDMA
jgi:hypothetical protein